ncbi:pentatricopeptide repeat-containing protein At5g66520 [Ricinus communis]|uniref:pentatricopeptide repeat-containing protein At5g66520 n=1 Tax=Ricinus communis TaxID=3988 RepID=UPI00201ADB38|nr:pentatricopeptide repeat-containing protein At5g66520 [Ricinus communis]
MYRKSMLSSTYVKASKKTLFLLDKCRTISQIKQIQTHLTVSGTLKDPYAAAKIISFCALSSNQFSLSHAYRLFLGLRHRSTFIWNTVIRAFAEKNEPRKAIMLFKNMLYSNFLPNNYTYSFLFKACTDLNNLYLGLACHCQSIKLGWEFYDFVQNGLVHMFAIFGCMDSARKLFDLSSNRDVITWTALINGYVRAGQVLIGRELFDKMPERNSVSWSAMITGYVRVGFFEEALELFNAMLISGFWPNHAGIVCAINACASLGALDQGRWIHCYIKRNRMDLDRVMGAALIDMYAKCGCIEIACSIFGELRNRDVHVYTCLISGLANHGQSATAVELFERMHSEGVVPNEVTFVSVLNACSRMGLVDKGLRIFENMSKIYGVEPQVQHYGCLVDLLGRAGKLEEAKKLVKEMPMKPDSYVLGALLNASRVYGDVELGEETVESLAQLSLDHSGVHVVLSNMYASANKWDEVARVRRGMGDKKVRKVPGCSLIKVDGG